jgi:inosine/xanthosine triphosphate pyrophosphatase family protein
MWQVLSIGETVEEVSDSGFLAQAPTLRTQLLADDSMLQVSSLLKRPTSVSHHC